MTRPTPPPRTFTTARGNLIELIGCERGEDGVWQYIIKVNGQHVREMYTEEQLNQMKTT